MTEPSDFSSGSLPTKGFKPLAQGSDTLAQSSEFLAQCVEPLAEAYARGDAVGIFAVLDQATRPVIGQTLCTANRYEPGEEKLFRLYSSNTTAYSPGGSKSKGGTPWGEHVLHQRRVYIGEGEEVMRQVFDDSDTILALGLRSVINVPVVFDDVCLGTFNFLMPHDTVLPLQVHWARLAGLLSVPAFNASRRRSG